MGWNGWDGSLTWLAAESMDEAVSRRLHQFSRETTNRVCVCVYVCVCVCVQQEIYYEESGHMFMEAGKSQDLWGKLASCRLKKPMVLFHFECESLRPKELMM